MSSTNPDAHGPSGPSGPPGPGDDAVRRLLADARHDEPTPPDVVARLDRVLADLQARSTPLAPPEPEVLQGPGSDLARRRAARRGRRTERWGRLVAASVAAAFVLGGGYLLSTVDQGGGSADSASGGSALEGEAPAAAGPRDGSAFDTGGDEEGVGYLPYLRPDHLRADLRARAPYAGPAAGDGGGTPPRSCVVAEAGQRALAVSYGGRLAAVVYDPPRGGRQQVTVYACSGVHGGDELRSLTVPSRP